MKKFIKKHLATLVTAPAFTFYIFLLPADHKPHKMEMNASPDRGPDNPANNILFISAPGKIMTASWTFEFGTDR